MELTPPIIVLIGLTGAGKSTTAKLLETQGTAKRVLRQTTRKPREDDDPAIIQCVETITSGERDFVTYGWGSDVYCVPHNAVKHVRDRGLYPVVELGTYYDARALWELQKPGYIVLVERANSESTLREICIARGMRPVDIEERIASFLEDKTELEQNRSSIDFILTNNGSVEDLQVKIRDLLSHIDFRSQHIT